MKAGRSIYGGWSHKASFRVVGVPAREPTDVAGFTDLGTISPAATIAHDLTRPLCHP